MAEAMTPVVDGSTLSAPAFSGKPENFQADMALLAQEQGTDAQPLPPEPSNPAEQPAQPPAPVTNEAIPDKFKNPDGSVSVEKIEKSTVNAQDAYERYRQKELELQRKMSEVNRMQQPNYQSQPQPQYQPQNAQPVYQSPQNVPMTLEQQINSELAANPQNPGAVLSKLFSAAANMGYQQAIGEIQTVRQETELVKRQKELETIAQKDEWVLSPEGIDALSKIRAERPWVNSSPNPWTSAYKEILADRVLNGQSVQQVKTPNPKVATAPVAPVGTVDRTQRQPVQVDTADKQSLDNLFRAKTPQEEAALFKQLGFNVDRWSGK